MAPEAASFFLVSCAGGRDFGRALAVCLHGMLDETVRILTPFNVDEANRPDAIGCETEKKYYETSLNHVEELDQQGEIRSCK